MLLFENNRMIKIKALSQLFTVLFTLFFVPILLAKESNPSAIFLNPGAKGDAFFEMMSSFMQAAADDLEFDLEIVYCDRNHFKLRQEGERILNRSELPDYLILINEKNGVLLTLQEASHKGVKVVLINEGLKNEDRIELGGPGETLTNWILEYLPNDEQAGYLLAKSLIIEAINNNPTDNKSPINVVGISGNFNTNSSDFRTAGLKRALKEFPKVQLKQVVPAYWEKEKAIHVTNGLLGRYSDVNIIWAASDLMALGAAEAVSNTNFQPGTDILIGGIDWADLALDNIKNGTLTATVGGHFMDGGWAMVMLYDYHNGIPLPQPSYTSNFSVITKKNIHQFEQLFNQFDPNKIDFKKFSLKDNFSTSGYNFGLQQLLRYQEP